jgi:chemotaxis signal transduction protein
MEAKEIFMMLGLILTISINSVIVAYSYGKLSKAVEELSKMVDFHIKKLESVQERQRELELKQLEDFVKKEDMLVFTNKAEAIMKEVMEELRHVRRAS